MLFNTIDFIVFFVVVLTILTALKNRYFQHVFLLLASYFFFYYTSNYLIVLLIFTTVWDYYFGNYIYQAKDIKIKKLILIASLAGNLGLLGFFKYADFAITQINFLGNYFDFGTNIPLLNLVLPIAISFYTFHSITYTVSIYRNQISPAKSFIEYAIFVAFFPQLVAGPILRAKEFLPQLREKLDNFGRAKLRQIAIEPTNLKIGITMIAFGFLKKVFFADNIAPLVNHIFNNPIGLDSLTIILGTIGFGIQIYCDFSGYSDIAIGAALIMGFKIPINFNKPYFATSPSDFWKRWHISLSSWLRDYLYIPLGGNQKSRSRTYLNLFIVMFLGGLWHGASWNFVIWGILHGSYLAVHKFLIDRFHFLQNNSFFNSKIGKILSILLMQYLVFLAWIPFRAKDLDHSIYSMWKFILFDFQTNGILPMILQYKIPFALILLFIIIHIVSYKKVNVIKRISNLNLKYWTIIIVVILGAIVFLYNGNSEDFIYFQF
jgi:alginate O-acetyltransferase complex protein AlgI